MKIYILGEDNYEGMDIHGLYSSREKAIEALPYFDREEDDIKEFEVDLPNTGDKYEEFYYYNIFPDGNEEHAKMASKPSEVEFIRYGSLNRREAAFQGYGRTVEEAKANAYKAKSESHPIWQVYSDKQEVHHADKSNVYSMGKEFGNSEYFCAIHEDRNVCIIAIEEYKKTGKVSEFLRFSDKE